MATCGTLRDFAGLHGTSRDFAGLRGTSRDAEDERKETYELSPRNGRGERGGCDLLKGRLIGWVNPRFFFAGTALGPQSEKSEKPFARRVLDSMLRIRSYRRSSGNISRDFVGRGRRKEKNIRNLLHAIGVGSGGVAIS
jgi:hypothetical protein